MSVRLGVIGAALWVWAVAGCSCGEGRDAGDSGVVDASDAPKALDADVTPDVPTDVPGADGGECRTMAARTATCHAGDTSGVDFLCEPHGWGAGCSLAEIVSEACFVPYAWRCADHAWCPPAAGWATDPPDPALDSPSFPAESSLPVWISFGERVLGGASVEALDCGSEVRVIVSPCGMASSSPTAGDTLEVLVTLPASTLPVRVELAPPTAACLAACDGTGARCVVGELVTRASDCGATGGCESADAGTPDAGP